MKRPEDEILLRDMVDHAGRAIAAVAGRRRGDLDGMRNRRVHGYASVDHDIVWTVVTSDLPSLVREIGRVGD